MSDDYRAPDFDAAILAAASHAIGGWTAYVVKREEIRGMPEWGAIKEHQWRELKRFGWQKLMELTTRIVEPAEAAR